MRAWFRRRGAAARADLTARARAGGDDGFTLIELLVSLGVIGTVMTALTSFFVTTVGVAGEQSGRQAAARIAADGTERVRAMAGSDLLTGRDPASVHAAWGTPPPGVDLSGTAEASDATATAGSGATAALPTTPETVTTGGVDYARYWYIGRCWQPRAGGDCDATAATGDTPLLRVVVAVVWPHKRCPAGTCRYVTTTLASDAWGEPVFGTPATAPVPAAQPDRTGEVGVAVTGGQLTGSGGTAPLTWSATGLPPGITLTPAGVLSGTPTTATGSPYQVTVRLTDALGLTGTVAFRWTVAPRPSLTSPGAQSTATGTAVSLPIQVTGGTGPLTWSATGLPAGLSIGVSTGTITGRPTTATPATTVTVTVTDAYGVTATTSFTWTVRSSLTVATPPAQTSQSGSAITPVTVVASGGTTPYGWSAVGLPPGLTINGSGVISGTPTVDGSYQVSVTVTDAARATATTSLFTWTVQGGVLQITSPVTTQSSTADDTVNLTARASWGGWLPCFLCAWSGSNLPDGLTISSGGQITGKVGDGTRYLTTLTVVDIFGNTDSVTFVWNVAPRNNGDLRISQPSGDRAGDRVGTAISPFTAQTSGGGGNKFTWTATGLPPGVTMTGAGAFSGTPTRAGVYTVRLDAVDNNHKTATYMFTWTVSP